MNYTEKDFAGCLFNPLKKDLFKAYPRLSVLIQPIEESAEILSPEFHDKLIRYILLVYDPQSPAIKEFRDFKIRKQTCASLAGFDLKKDDVFLEGLYSFSNGNALYAVNAFLKNFIHSRLWYMICAREQTIYEYAERMMKPVEAKDGDKERDLMSAIAIKSKLSADMASMNELLEQDHLKYFGSDTDLIKAAKTKRFTPEEMATKV